MPTYNYYDTSTTGGWVTFDNTITTGNLATSNSSWSFTDGTVVKNWFSTTTPTAKLSKLGKSMSARTSKKKKGSKDRVDNTRLPITAKVYFQFLKTKLSKQEQVIVKERLTNVQRMINATLGTGQKALFENLGVKLMEITKESEIFACGYDRYLLTKHIDMMKKVKEFKENNLKVASLENFPRVIPKLQRQKIEQSLKKGIFDGIDIYYLDYSKEEVKTNERKIRDKDPIAFGRVNELPDRYYYICDWVDKYCDLTLDRVLDKFVNDDEFRLEEIPQIQEKYLTKMFKDIWLGKKKRLSNTNSSSYKKDAEIDKAETEKLMKKGKFINKVSKIFKRK